MTFDLIPGVQLENTAGNLRLLYFLEGRTLRLPVTMHGLKSFYGFLAAVAANTKEDLQVSVTGRLRFFYARGVVRSTVSGVATIQTHPVDRVQSKRARAKIKPYL